MSCKWKWGILGVVLVLVVILGTFNIGCAPAAPTSGSPIIIGNLACFTGLGSPPNPWMLRGAELACDEFGWEIAGRKIKLINEDSASDPTIAADKAKKLLEVDKADVIIGPLPANAAFPVATILKSSGKPQMSVTEYPPELLQIGDHVFSHAGTQRSSGYFVGIYAYDKLGYRTATIIHDDVLFAEEFLQGAMDGFVSRGGQIVQRQRTPMESMDYGPFLSTMKKADVCIFWFIPPHAFAFVNQYNKYGLEMPLVQAGNFTLSQEMLADLGESAVGLIGLSAYDANIRGNDVKKWVDRWVKLHGDKDAKDGNYPGVTEGAGMYVGTSIVLQAIENAKGDTTPSVLRTSLKKIKAKTPWGPVSFTDGRVGIGNLYIMKVVKEGGKYIGVDTYKYDNVVRDEPADAKDKAPKM